MGKLSRIGGYFIALVLSVIAFFIGGRINYELIKYLGGQYGIMTEFYSDWAYLTHHKFSEFRNASLILAFVAIILLIKLSKRGKSAKKPLFISLLVFAAGCLICAAVISPPLQIYFFILMRACCFLLYIAAVYVILVCKKG